MKHPSEAAAAAAIGIDFGTTNSSVAWARPDGVVQLARFPLEQSFTESYRSLLYLEQHRTASRTSVRSWTGPFAIEQYLAASERGRLIQSLKSFLANRGLTATEIFSKRHTIEELIARILGDLREAASREFGVDIRRAVAGRPVAFVGAEADADSEHAERRLREAFTLAGFTEVEFALEPVAAAHYYESTLESDELILIGDFGGGTSDFSLLRVGPGHRRPSAPRQRRRILGSAGLGLAGDAFDARIVRNVVAPALGAGSLMRSLDKLLPVPVWLYSHLERWHHLSLLKGKDVTSLLHSVKAQAVEPEKIEALMELISDELGYRLHRAVQRTKLALSGADSAEFRFTEGSSLDLAATVTRSDFEEWIAEDLQRIERCVDGLLAQARVEPAAVDRVFLTGGTSLVPAVRRIFAGRFGEERLRSGNEFTSVARGLAVMAAAKVTPARAGRGRGRATASAQTASTEVR